MAEILVLFLFSQRLWKLALSSLCGDVLHRAKEEQCLADSFKYESVCAGGSTGTLPPAHALS